MNWIAANGLMKDSSFASSSAASNVIAVLISTNWGRSINRRVLMTEQYEQITDWNGWMKAYLSRELFIDTSAGMEEIDRLDFKPDLASIYDKNLAEGRYYRKVEPEQVELVEWKYLLEGADELFKYVRPTVNLDPDYWYRTGYIIEGVRVKA
jgi:hypothetical protein